MRRRDRIAGWASALFLATCAVAQDPPQPVPQEGPVTGAAVQARLDEVTADAALDAELKAALTGVLTRALESAKARETHAAAMAALPTPEQIAAELTKNRALLAAAGNPRAVVVPPAVTLDAATTSLTQAQQQLAAAQTAATDEEKEAVRRTSRRNEIPARLVELRRALEALPQAVTEENVDTRLLAARRLRLTAERQRLEVETAALQAEQQSYVARDQLLTVKRDLAVRRANNAQAEVDAWQMRVQSMRSAAAVAAQEAARQAEQEAKDAHPLLRELAAENAAVAARLTPLIDKQQAVEQYIASAKGLLERLQAQYLDIKTRADGAGSTLTLGRMLREGRAKLPDVYRIFRRQGGYDDAIVAEAYLASIDWEQRRRRLADDPQLVDTLIDMAAPPITVRAQRVDVARRAGELIDQRLAMLETLSENSSQYLARLQVLETTRKSVREVVAEYRTFVNERVLWIRSSSAIWGLDLAAAASALLWFASPAAWWHTASATVATAAADVWPVLVLLVLLGTIALQHVWRRRLRHYGELGGRNTNTRYVPTAMALLMTVLLAAPLPGFLWLLSWSLGHSPDAGEFGKSMSAGVMQCAVLLAIYTSLRQLIRSDGLAEVHFGWRREVLASMRHNLWLLVPVAFPLAAGLGALEKHGNDAWLGSLGRLLLLPLLLLLMILLRRLLHARTGLLVGGNSIFARFRGLWLLLTMTGFVGLFAMAGLGFEYTVVQLVRSIVYTIVILLGFTLASALFLRALLLQRRRLSIQKARESFETARAARGRAAEATGEEEFDPTAEEFELDPSSIAKQTHALIRVVVVIGALFACLAVWAEVLPALGIFREVDLWTDSSTEPPIQITLADLLKGLLIALLTLIAARNIPGLLELLVLQRLRIQAGERHAITTLARYVLVAIGIVMAFGAIGLGWSKVQWLIAAVSLGLGFGLQEIFANFVSGLILLFERPVRVGDWVQVGDWLGKVVRIKIRATTVRDLDNRELVVPNKEFVTGRFVNWTLSDSLVRLRLPVGVAYGSNTELAKKLLIEAAAECDLVAKTPPARAMFLGFGDSALDLELRVFIEDYQQHAPLLDELHGRVDRLFRDHGIEIAFPQRDLHLRSAKPLAEFLDRRATEPDAD